MDERTAPLGGAGLAQEFVTLNEVLGMGGDSSTALQRLVDLAVTVIPGCDWAAITARPPTRKPHSLASSGDVARAVDQLQYDLGDGPCMAAAEKPTVVRIPDLGCDTRFPTFSVAASEATPVRSVMSLHLVEQPAATALNLYGATAGALDDEAVTIAALFAAHARVLLMHAGSNDKATSLAAALTSSRQIGAAVGILMNARRITADAAFELLRASSQQLNRKLRDIASEVTETGSLPSRSTRLTE